MQQRDIEAFLYREARILDSREYKQWLDLTTHDVIYHIPLNDRAADPTAHISIINDNRKSLETRVWRIYDFQEHHTQEPPVQTVRFISNVETEIAGDLEYRVQCCCLLHGVRSGAQRRNLGRITLAMHSQYILREEKDGLRIARKRLELLDMDAEIGGLTFIL